VARLVRGDSLPRAVGGSPPKKIFKFFKFSRCADGMGSFFEPRSPKFSSFQVFKRDPRRPPDEATSALDPASQDKLMELLTKELTTIVSVGHRPELEAFHNRKIILERRSGGAKFVTDIRLGAAAFSESSGDRGSAPQALSTHSPAARRACRCLVMARVGWNLTACGELNKVISREGRLPCEEFWPVPLWRRLLLRPALRTITSFRSRPRSDAGLLRNGLRHRASVW
jgi:hypothetical protein